MLSYNTGVREQSRSGGRISSFAVRGLPRVWEELAMYLQNKGKKRYREFLFMKDRNSIMVIVSAANASLWHAGTWHIRA
jgi:hypothetical protein